ncbi:MAG: hypothetical protein V3U75_07715 [Methylococcaceae bacterium]
MMTFGETAYAEDQLKAFACAQGYGASTTGGRGGDVYHVTKLLDDGSSGTLRHALDSAKGPRTVVFDIGGIVKLNSRLKIRTNNITLAGQTAPGGGITLAGYPLDIIERSDVIIRYMRFRVGDYNARDPKGGNDGKGNMNLGGAGGDAINAERSNRLIIDHISASWSMDETVDILDSKNVTLQHSIVSEGLYNSFHPKGHHSRGLMLFAGVTDNELANGDGGYTIYQNLMAHSNLRNPVVGGQMTLDPGQAEKDRKFMRMHFENNVIYNWGERSGHTGRPQTQMNYVNNYLIAGPSTTAKNLNTAMHEENGDEGDFFIYFAGNYMDTDKDSIHNGQPVESEAFLGFEAGEILDKALPFSFVDPALSAEDAYQEILDHAGASLTRDDVDMRVIDDVLNRTGSIIDSQDDVGGLGSIANGTAPVDSDHDGMPDSWESTKGLDPNDASDGNKIDLNLAGYTNLEIYLDSIVESAGHCGTNNVEIVPPITLNDNERENPAAEFETDSQKTTTLELQISTSSDDAEEKDFGRVITGSKDLDLVRSGSNQTVGMRFTIVNIPRSAIITQAHIQFTAAKVRSETTNLIIEGQAHDDASSFQRKVAFDISPAPTTLASVPWSPKAWSTIGESGFDQRTPNIAPIIQEIIDRPNWNQGNSLAVIISGTGKREAQSYDSNPNAAPTLHVEYVLD